MNYHYVLRASYGNDSVALIQWAKEEGLENVAVLYNDTGWASSSWPKRVAELETLARSYGFDCHRTLSIGFEALAREKQAFPRQGIQFCTSELKIQPTMRWLEEYDPLQMSVSLIGVRREESFNRRNYSEFDFDLNGYMVWAPLVAYTTEERDHLLSRAGVTPLPHRSHECFPCINSNRKDILELSEERIDEIEKIEVSMGRTKNGKPRTLFRPYRYMGATGIREISRWAKSGHGKFELDDGNGSSGCEAGWCGV